MITEEQKKAIDCIISIFETGKIPSLASYSTCTILKDGAGISYGKHQSTDKSGSLDRIVQKYIADGGSKSAELKPFLDELAANATAALNPVSPPTWAVGLMTLLKEAGADPKMQAAQDYVFNEGYWFPAQKAGKDMGLTLPLSYCILYDTAIHSGPGGIQKIRALFPEGPPAKGGDEKAWCYAYIKARRGWLQGSSNPLVQKTIYRMD